MLIDIVAGYKTTVTPPQSNNLPAGYKTNPNTTQSIYLPQWRDGPSGGETWPRKLTRQKRFIDLKRLQRPGILDNKWMRHAGQR